MELVEMDFIVYIIQSIFKFKTILSKLNNQNNGYCYQMKWRASRDISEL